jgi:hypothetical protein
MENDLVFHFAVWNNDEQGLQDLLENYTSSVSKSSSGGASAQPNEPNPTSRLEYRDKRGNTPLLLAYRLGRTKLARMLLAAGADPRARARECWEPVQIASLTHNTDLIRTAVIAFLAETDNAFSKRLPKLQAALASLPDFSMRMQWEFSTWVPLLSRLLPSDEYAIWKRGNELRIDTTLLGMTGLKWERGSISMILKDGGKIFVLDNDLKTAADARMAFTNPQDRQIQDWVRKLLTSEQKTTDFWSRDCVMQPVIKQGLLGGMIFNIGSSLGLVDQGVRGRVTEGKDITRAATQPYVENPDQVKADVGVWENCPIFEMRNLCVRDVKHPAFMKELKLSDWWKDEYSRQLNTSDELDTAQALETAKQAEEEIRAKGDRVATDEAPELMLKPLQKLLKAIRLGKVNAENAQSATIEQLEGIKFEDEDDDDNKNGGKLHTAVLETFEDAFGVERTNEKHAPNARVCYHNEGNLETQDKILDLKVAFSKNFPLTVEQFIPVAEMLARTSTHASNIKAFFQNKMPAGAGFPVQFQIPVFPTVTATVTFGFMDAKRTPPKSLFDVPSSYKMGAYVERGFVRQL